MDLYNLISLAGVFGLLFFAWVCSTNRRVLNWRAVVWGTALQLALGVLVLWLPVSRLAFQKANDLVLALLKAATAGQKFVFGPLALSPGETGAGGETSIGFILATQALPVIVFFSALMSLLYYLGVMQAVIRAFARIFTRLMRVSGAESLCTASSIFVGIESATTIRPYLAAMTPSEFCTILTAGMATVASSTLGLYVLFLSKTFPTIAGHLISASIMSAPAALVMSKLLLPETGTPATMGAAPKLQYERESSAVESVISGAMAGVKLVVGIVALLVAFLGLLALVDLGLGWFGRMIGQVASCRCELSLAGLLSYVFAPFAVMIGVPPADAMHAARLFAERLVATEVPAYMHLAQYMEGNVLSHPRSAMIIAYVLCGFAHVGSLAIFVGGTAALVPERRTDLARVGPRALLAATLACLMTGAVAGTFFHPGAMVLGR